MPMLVATPRNSSISSVEYASRRRSSRMISAPEQLVLAREAERHRAVHLLQRAQHELQALLLLGRDRAARRHLALDALDGDDAGAAQALEEGAVGDGVEARLGPRADVAGQLEPRPVGIGEVDRRVGDAPRVLQRASTRGTSTRMSMTLASSARSISMRRDSSNFSWNIQRLIAASTRTRIGSIRMTIVADASSVLKKNSRARRRRPSAPARRRSAPG